MQLVTAQTGMAPAQLSSSSLGFLNPPEEVLEGHVLYVFYHCERHQVVHLDVVSSSLSSSSVSIFKRRWSCSPGEGHRFKTIRLEFPDKMVYREDYFIRNSIYVFDVVLRGWILDYPSDYVNDWSSYDKGLVRTFHSIMSSPPFSRPFKHHKKSVRWDQEIIWRLIKDKLPQCQAEPEVTELLSFVYACTGESFGVSRTMENFSDRVLERQRIMSILSPSCSFSTWLYIVQECPFPVCSIWHHVGGTNEDYQTPSLFVTNTGHLHVQVNLVSGEAQAFQSWSSLPINKWCQIHLTIEMFLSPVYLDDTLGFFILGGSRFVAGISGFFGPSVYHRNKVIHLHQVHPPKLMESLNLPWWFHKCHQFKEECVAQYNSFLSHTRPHPESCGDVYQELLAQYRLSFLPRCLQWEAPPLRKRAAVTRLLRRRAKLGGPSVLNTELIGQELYRIYMKRFLASLGLSGKMTFQALLFQAGCLGHDTALYLASVLFQTGFGVKRDWSKALLFKLVSAQRDERLSLLSLGHKHHLGADNYPVDYGLSYAYYSNIARQTMVDRLRPEKEQAYVENIRLIDEDVLKMQTKEDDDLFMWLRYQAKQGVSSAQQAVGRMLFWGQQGITSNLHAAVKYYEKGAMEQKDPVMMYDYGVVLLKGQGVKQDIPKALEFLKKAADLDFVPAINSLGWYYENFEKNYQKAIEYWERADDLGNHEAPFNLGIMHFYGLYPGKAKSYTAAYHYYLKSAMRGHIDGAVHISAFWIQGFPGVVPRQPNDAVIWTKWAAEHNGYLGAQLRKGLDGYFKQSWLEALLHYIQAAEAGSEIGQFNAAFICEQNPDASRHVQTDCMWKYYNLSVYSDRPSSYAQIKMGDLLYTSHGRRKRDVQAAVHMYKAAALQKDPQGLYNLGILIEEGNVIPLSTLHELGLNSSMWTNNYTIVMELYRRCRDQDSDESYVPCALALFSTHIRYAWTFHSSLLKCSGAAVTIVTALSLMTILGRLRHGPLNQPQSV
ncbi:hypothetical protein GDO86_004805 [Hymenochirus boettgeri]|uniref:Uncharacterized protein n=1 Tax=Hymenochirus boettgeri TaxID=247094 RepID=A0A8T2K9R2_9PIPI|nr:hypothetical protein GDO86_004805 [Hymenochirus boettgeri]